MPDDKSHISDEVRAELAKQSPEIRKGVLDVADRDARGEPYRRDVPREKGQSK